MLAYLCGKHTEKTAHRYIGESQGETRGLPILLPSHLLRIVFLVFYLDVSKSSPIVKLEILALTLDVCLLRLETRSQLVCISGKGQRGHTSFSLCVIPSTHSPF